MGENPLTEGAADVVAAAIVEKPFTPPPASAHMHPRHSDATLIKAIYRRAGQVKPITEKSYPYA